MAKSELAQTRKPPDDAEEKAVAVDVDHGLHSPSVFALPPAAPKPSPIQTAGMISRITFHEVTGLLMLGAKRQIQQEDLYEVEVYDQAGYCCDTFIAEWQKEVERWKAKQKSKPGGAPKRPSLYRVLVGLYWAQFLSMLAMHAVFAAATLAGPNLMKLIIQFVADPSIPMWKGYAYAAAFASVPMCGAVCCAHFLFRGFRVGMRARAIIAMVVYRKSLALSTAARQNPEMTQGKIVTLMSIDGQAFVEGLGLITYLFVSPAVVVVIIALLYTLVGPSCFSGLGVMLCVFPLSFLIARKSMKLTYKQKRQTDQRVTILSEILQGIRIIKFNAWETSFSDKVGISRAKELSMLWRLALLRALNTFIMYATPIFVAIATFGTYFALGNELTAAVAFPTIALFTVLRVPLSFIPMVISNTVKMNIAKNRITDFLLAEEAESSTTIPDDPNVAISIEKAAFYWMGEEHHSQSEKSDKSGNKTAEEGKVSEIDGAVDTKRQKPKMFQSGKRKMSLSVGRNMSVGFELHELSLNIRKGELVAVVGTVGSGKTSLLSAMIGDMERKRGTVSVCGSMAYAGQVPWILNGTVQDNILFGRPMDAQKYNTVLDACAMLPDLKILKGGDLAEIGERGITLSGGQKQRISIARAAYSGADIVLLDDPLSAVDSHVGKHLFNRCIRGLMKNATRVLVTNQLHVLPKCDRIVVMQDGRIAEIGTFEQLMNLSNGELRGLMEAYGQGSGSQAEPEAPQTAGAQGGTDIVPQAGSRLEGKLMEEESRHVGHVTVGVYGKYMQAAGGILYVIAVVLGIGGNQAAQTIVDWWLAGWTSNMNGRPSGPYPGRESGFYFAVYCVLGMVTQAFIIFRTLVLAYGGIRASRILHFNLLGSMLRARMGFFDSTPLGRIVNRFSKDMDQVDQYMTQNLESMFVSFADLMGTFVLVSIVFPWFAAVLLPVAAGFIVLSIFFRRTSRELQRLESTTRSPIYTQFSETLAGVSTIRSYRDQKRFIDLNTALVDGNNRSFLILQMANRWLQIRMELVNLIVLLAVALLCVTGRQRNLDPSLAGLVMAYVLGIIQTLNWTVRQTAEVEARMTSVERILEYSDIALAESSHHSDPNKKPPSDWPQHGHVQIDGLTLRYRPDLPQVLKGVHVDIRPGEKVGIVGRTGSGKSSLMVALFRLVELEGGKIVIDGVDTTSLGLADLRSKIAIIPQDPILFSQQLGAKDSAFGKVGGIRFNLDPLGRYSDSELWSALDSAQMGDVVRALPHGLDAQVTENGSNFSVGQRQLLCLARALLKKPKVLVLDEATANVDVDTDLRIQRTIRECLHGVTCLTIAHRLHTIMDSDKVLVMDSGNVAQFGPPGQLVDNPNGILLSLINETGPKSAQHLVNVAKGKVSIFAQFDESQRGEAQKMVGGGEIKNGEKEVMGLEGGIGGLGGVGGVGCGGDGGVVGEGGVAITMSGPSMVSFDNSNDQLRGGDVDSDGEELMGMEEEGKEDVMSILSAAVPVHSMRGMPQLS